LARKSIRPGASLFRGLGCKVEAGKAVGKKFKEEVEEGEKARENNNEIGKTI
jgi:hypothetical protein